MQPAPHYHLVQKGDELHVVTLDVDSRDPLALEQLKVDLHSQIDHELKPRLVIDMTRIKDVSSSMLGLIMGMHMKIRSKQGALRLCNLCEGVSEVFALMLLHRILPLDDTVAMSLERINDGLAS